ncbi:hypothetical protein BH09GEM1_BH09GEM1_00090 [soil metagenome]
MNGSTDYSTTPLTQLSFLTSGGQDAFDSVDGRYSGGDNLVTAQAVVATPEPASLTLVASDLLGMLGVAHRRRQRTFEGKQYLVAVRGSSWRRAGKQLYNQDRYERFGWRLGHSLEEARIARPAQWNGP